MCVFPLLLTEIHIHIHATTEINELKQEMYLKKIVNGHLLLEKSHF